MALSSRPLIVSQETSSWKDLYETPSTSAEVVSAQIPTDSLESSIQEALNWWMEENNIGVWVPLSLPPPELLVFTDASLEGWGARLRAYSSWDVARGSVHINLLKMKAVLMALMNFKVYTRVSECGGRPTKSLRPGDRDVMVPSSSGSKGDVSSIGSSGSRSLLQH